VQGLEFSTTKKKPKPKPNTYITATTKGERERKVWEKKVLGNLMCILPTFGNR
jgi:hypothetical protein